MGGPPLFLDAALTGFLATQVAVLLLRVRGAGGEAVGLALFLSALALRMAAARPELGGVPVSYLIAWPAGDMLLSARARGGRPLWAATNLLCAGMILLASGLGFGGTVPFLSFRLLTQAAVGLPPILLALGLGRRQRSPLLLCAAAAGGALFAAGAAAAALSASGRLSGDFPGWAILPLSLCTGWLVLVQGYPRDGRLQDLGPRGLGTEAQRQGVYAQLLRTEAALLLQDRLTAAGLLALGAAHEFKGTMAHIRAAADSALSRDEGGRLRQGLGLVRDLAENGQRSAVDYLERLSREGREDARDAELAEIAGGVLALLRPSLRATGIVVLADFPSGLRVRVRRGEIEQVLFNLVRNAAESYVQQGGDGERVIELLARRVDRTAVLEVRDSAGGVSPEAAARLFEINPSRSGGTGLGLYIARGLAERNGALLGYEPRDGGSCFRLEVPLEEGLADQPGPEASR